MKHYFILIGKNIVNFLKGNVPIVNIPKGVVEG
jgi:hypothetical protein